MNDLEGSVVEVAALLESLSIPHMLVGGLAVSLWGEARATLDVDWAVWVEPEDLERTITALCQRVPAAPSRPLEFVRRTRVLPVTTVQGVRADIIFATLPWEEQAISRSHTKLVAGKSVSVVSVEDLILMKIISERQKDIEDARRLLRRYRTSLDRGYLEPLLRELAESLARPDALATWEEELGDGS